MHSLYEPSHGRGAPEVPEPPTLGAQYLTRYDTWKKFVRATRMALLCASPKTNKRVKVSSYLLVHHLGNSVGQKPLAKRVQPLPWGDSYVQPVRPGSVSVGRPGLGASGSCAMLRSAASQLIRQSIAPSSHRAYTSGFRSWTHFRGLIRVAPLVDTSASNTDNIQPLLEFVVWVRRRATKPVLLPVNYQQCYTSTR